MHSVLENLTLQSCYYQAGKTKAMFLRCSREVPKLSFEKGRSEVVLTAGRKRKISAVNSSVEVLC